MTHFIHTKGCCVKTIDGLVISELFLYNRQTITRWQNYTHGFPSEILTEPNWYGIKLIPTVMHGT